MKKSMFGFVLLLALLTFLGGGVGAQGMPTEQYIGPISTGLHAAPAIQPNELVQTVAESALGDPVYTITGSSFFAYSGGQILDVPSPPAPMGWATLNFDDSGWSDVTEEAIFQYDPAHGGVDPWVPWKTNPLSCLSVTNTMPVRGPGADTDLNEITYLIRREFTIPTPQAGYTLAEVRVYSWADNAVILWLNGERFGSPRYMGNVDECVPPYFLRSRTAASGAPQIGNNVLAMQLSNNNVPPAENPINPIGVAFRVEAVFSQAAQADLAVTKTVDNPTPNEGDTITYDIVVTNNGPDMATNVRVTDVLPAGLTFVSSSADQGSYDSATGVWTVGNLANGASATLTISASVDAGTGGSTITNTATAEADEPDPDPTNNTDSEDIRVLLSDLDVVKTVDNPTPNEGDTITYDIVATNNGPDAATGVTVTDALPAGVTFVSSSATQGSYDSATGVWTVGDLANGASATLTITATVDAGTGGSTLTNTACVDADQADPDAGNNCGDAEITVQQADLSVEKTVDNPTPGEGTTFAYSLVVTNNGPDAATGVNVTDALPAGVTFVSSSATQGSYDSATGVWTVGDLANGASATLTITATVNTGTSGSTITNTACVSGDQADPDASNDCSDADITIPVPPAGTDKLTARVFIDRLCDGFFIDGVDVPMAGVTVMLEFPNGATMLRDTTPFGWAYFPGFDASGGVTISADMPATYAGYTLGMCPDSSASVDLSAGDFASGHIAHKHIEFRAAVLR